MTKLELKQLIKEVITEDYKDLDRDREQDKLKIIKFQDVVIDLQEQIEDFSEEAGVNLDEALIKLSEVEDALVKFLAHELMNKKLMFRKTTSDQKRRIEKSRAVR
jgi:hypothetical protein